MRDSEVLACTTEDRLRLLESREESRAAIIEALGTLRGDAAQQTMALAIHALSEQLEAS